jgi:hypothetical protein
MLNCINLTPHDINIVDGNNNPLLSLPPSGELARVNMETSTVTAICPLCMQEHVLECGCMVPRIPVVRSTPGPVKGLPDPVDGTILLFSRLVKSVVPERNDVMVPDDMVRDDQGRVMGCRRLSL